MEEAVAEVWDSSTAVDKALRYVTYLYLVHVSSSLTISVLYMEHEIWVKRFMYYLEGNKLQRVFASLPDSVAAAMGIMKPQPPNTAVVQPDQRTGGGEQAPSGNPAFLVYEEEGPGFCGKPISVRR